MGWVPLVSYSSGGRGAWACVCGVGVGAAAGVSGDPSFLGACLAPASATFLSYHAALGGALGLAGTPPGDICVGSDCRFKPATYGDVAE